MATIPNKIAKFADLEKDSFSTIAQANWQKAAGLLEYANKSFPIGMLLFFYASQDNLPAQPDTNYWKFMDGTAVNNPNSPMHGQVVPDLRGRFFKHPGTGQPALVEAGANSVSIVHNHSGNTGEGWDFGPIQLDGGAERAGSLGVHTHTVSVGGSSAVPTIPAYREVQVYMRIA